MAGLRGLKSLLLLTGLAALAICNGKADKATTAPNSLATKSPDPRTASSPLKLPANSSEATTAPHSLATKSPDPRTASSNLTLPANSSEDTSNHTSPSSTPISRPPVSHPNTTENQTSPSSTTNSQTQNLSATTQPVTISAATVTNSTKGPTPPPCSITATPIKYGFRVNISTNITGSFTVIATEEDSGSTQTFNHLTPMKPRNLTLLKPCTRYTLMAFTNEGDIIRNCTTESSTTKMSERDVEKVASKYHCYRSEWNISSTLREVWYPGDDYKNMSCININTSDTCTNVTTIFKPDKCPKFALHLTDFVYPNGSLSAPTRIPAKIEWPTEQQQCNGTVSFNYTCTEDQQGKQQTIELENMEPYTDYSCKVQLKYNNITNDHELKVNIDCGLDLKISNKTTNTSIQLEWNTTSKNCGKTEHDKLQYKCSCNSQSALKPSAHKMCNFTALKPYTGYDCKVQSIYNGKSTPKPIELRLRTTPGVPDKCKSLDVEFKENNAVIVKCEGPSNWYGEEKLYGAYLKGEPEREGKKKRCNFEFKDLSYHTKYKVVLIAFNGNLSSETTKEFGTGYNDKAVIGFLSFLIFLTSLALLCVLYKIIILRRRKSHDLNEHLELIPAANEEESLLNVEPIAAEVLLDSYKSKIADEGRLFLAEFQSVPRVFTRSSVKEAKKPYNAYKNRYVDILPYDYNRVQLTTGNGETGYDYINASFIDGFKECKKYIAAQGPKEETVTHFWRMVWEQQSSIIVMVTRCVEGNRTKCAQYWPSREREVELFDEFVVKLNREDHCPDYIISHLSITNKRDKNMEREVTHIQFIGWPDHGVPEEPHLLLKLRRRVNSFKNFFSGPIVIHCSAGVGRTGTYICIDAMMEGLEAEGRVDIYGYVVRLRRQRGFMVQVEAQYILIHEALIEYNQFGETEILLPELHSTLSALKQTGSETEPSLLEEEYQRLPEYRNWRSSYAAKTEENKKKNRISSVIPYDFNRVLLRLEDDKSHNSNQDEDDDDDSSDEDDENSTMYINASHIDGYWAPHSFITTQGPLPHTTADLWRMVHQKRVKTIVMLSNCVENDTEMCSPYWGAEKKTYEDFEVEVTATDTCSTFTTRTIQLQYTKRKESRKVTQFHFLKWAGRELPENPKDLTDMIETIKKTCGYGNSISQRSAPIVVHCSDGSSRSGVFCALWNLLDSANTEKLVDVFQVAKAVRKGRLGAISSQEQYQFLYDALDGAFPAQNGEVKAPGASAVATENVQVINEINAAEPTAETKTETQAEEAVDSTMYDQKGAEVNNAVESTPLVADGGPEEEKKEAEGRKLSTEKMASKETTNGPIVNLEV